MWKAKKRLQSRRWSCRHKACVSDQPGPMNVLQNMATEQTSFGWSGKWKQLLINTVWSTVHSAGTTFLLLPTSAHITPLEMLFRGFGRNHTWITHQIKSQTAWGSSTSPLNPIHASALQHFIMSSTSIWKENKKEQTRKTKNNEGKEPEKLDIRISSATNSSLSIPYPPHQLLLRSLITAKRQYPPQTEASTPPSTQRLMKSHFVCYHITFLSEQWGGNLCVFFSTSHSHSCGPKPDKSVSTTDSTKENRTPRVWRHP